MNYLPMCSLHATRVYSTSFPFDVILMSPPSDSNSEFFTFCPSLGSVMDKHGL